MIFRELQTNVESVINRLDEMIVEAMMESESEIIDLNISQLDEGIGSDGLPLEPEYASDEYAHLKKAMGSKAPLGIPNLEVTGDFKSGFFADSFISGNEGFSGMLIDSNDEKSESLEIKYQRVFGIAPDNSDELLELIILPTQNRIKNEITKGIN